MIRSRFADCADWDLLVQSPFLGWAVRLGCSAGLSPSWCAWIGCILAGMSKKEKMFTFQLCIILGIFTQAHFFLKEWDGGWGVAFRVFGSPLSHDRFSRIYGRNEIR